MTSRDFAYWLQGFFEIHGQTTGLSVQQTDMIRRHLALVFIHEIDPANGGDAAKLQSVHDGAPASSTTGTNTGKPPVTQPGVLYRC